MIDDSATKHPDEHVLLDLTGPLRGAGALELAAPLALGQRGLVIAPPRTGATTVLRHIGHALAASPHDVDIRVVLAERPFEELLEWREVLPRASYRSTTTDVDDPAAHGALLDEVADAACAARDGANVAVLIDSMSALTRSLAATHHVDHVARDLDGGLPPEVLQQLRSSFAEARARANGDGSLTLVATVQSDTSLEFDEVVQHELVATGNVEWQLSAACARVGLVPALDVCASGARRDELILGDEEVERRAQLRSEVDRHGPLAGLDLLLEQLQLHGSLAALLDARGKLHP